MSVRSSSDEDGRTPSRVAIAVLPAAAIVVVLRRRARQRARASAWRYRTHGEVAAENQRILDAHGAVEPTAPRGQDRSTR